MIKVRESFVGIQGEGKLTGYRTLFIRLAGCNLAMEGHPCLYCDTPYSWEKDTLSVEFTSEQLAKAIDEASMLTATRFITITGGEPLIYGEELHNLLRMIGKFKNVSVETNGTLPIWKQYDYMWSMDLKGPSSGNVDNNCLDNLRKLTSYDQLKFVIADKKDYEWAISMAARVVEPEVIFQPSHGLLSFGELCDMARDDKRIGKIRIMTQQHKIAYPGVETGV